MRGTEAIVERTPSSKNRLDVQIRWLIRRDMSDVLRIEKSSYGESWTDEDFLTCLRQRNCIGMVAEHDQQIVGFMIYELHKSRLHILNFAVDPAARRHGIGTQMVLRLIDKLSQQRRSEILIEVRESDLETQLFFKEQGFRAVCVLRSHFDDTEEDAYTMRFRLDSEADSASPFAIRNRISEYDAA